MTRTRSLLLVGIVVLLLLACAGGAAWYYLYGPNKVSAAELVPGDTVMFATIPNAAAIATGYQTSHLKTLVDSPNMQPLIDAIKTQLGPKGLDLLNAFLPNLSGQSFIAITHFDIDKPVQVGFIAGMRPKAGLGDFNAFVEKLKTTWPDAIKAGSTGHANVAGVDYQWIQEPGSPDKICVAQVGGWIITTWGEASLQDWIERYQKKSATPSLAQNADYQKSLTRADKDPMTLVYFNYHAFVDIMQKVMAKTNPASGDYFKKQLGAIGGAIMTSSFQNGDIRDRFSILIPHQAQLDMGMGGATPCPFETLKFTGPDTRIYLGQSINLQQYWKNMQEQASATAAVNPIFGSIMTGIQNGAQGLGLDLQKNVIDPLGKEVSLQVEWSADTPFPEIGLFVKLDKPDDFKPALTAFIEAVRKAYSSIAVEKEINSNGHKFATLTFIQTMPISPTITEDGDYLGIFLTQNQAVRSFARDASITLLHNANFTRQVGDKRNSASQIIFVDSPQLLDRAYRTAMPYLSMASMFNKELGSLLAGKNLPPDLTWLAPMGTWSLVVSPDNDGIQGYSVSGVGNQGVVLLGGLGASMGVAQSMGLIPGANMSGATPGFPGNPGFVPNQPVPAPGPADDSTNAANPATPAPATTPDTTPAPTGTNPPMPGTPANSAPSTNTNATSSPAAPASAQ